MKLFIALLAGTLPLLVFAQVRIPEEQIPMLLKQAEAFTDAYERADAEAYLRMTHPSIDKYKVPREQVAQMLREAMLRPRTLGIVLEKMEVLRPSACYTASSEVVCFVPRRMTIRTNGEREIMKGYLLAARSIDGEQDWKFLDSDGFRRQRSLLWELFPALPENVETPPIAIEPAR